MSSFASESCDLLNLIKNDFQKDEFTPTKQCFTFCLALVVLTFIASTATRNYSQVDKLWSIVPFVYSWIFVCDARTVLMALVATIWGMRLTWNFNRRGGYKWPPWDGDEDYRWKYIHDGYFMKILQNDIIWAGFNFGFISLYQNMLLLLIVSPSLVSYLVATSCGESKLNIYDYVATLLFLFFVIIESIADNQQYSFQIEKYRLKTAGERLEGEYYDGFKQSGLFSIVRKPNYAAEQAIWMAFYIFSIAALQGQRLFNWSILGCILLSFLFQMSGWFTEKITLTKYPKYSEYMRTTPLYLPNPLRQAKEDKKSKKLYVKVQ